MNLFNNLNDLRIMDYSPITGLVDYGVAPKENMWITKMRCNICGGAWLAENYIDGTDICPKCGATGRDVIPAPNI